MHQWKPHRSNNRRFSNNSGRNSPESIRPGSEIRCNLKVGNTEVKGYDPEPPERIIARGFEMLDALALTWRAEASTRKVIAEGLVVALTSLAAVGPEETWIESRVSSICSSQ